MIENRARPKETAKPRAGATLLQKRTPLMAMAGHRNTLMAYGLKKFAGRSKRYSSGLAE
jgi:hypothetical protein